MSQHDSNTNTPATSPSDVNASTTNLNEDDSIPAIRFDPPLFLQRQSCVHRLLLAIRGLPKSTLLDVGCGDAEFLSRIVPCDDNLPLTRLAGIDLDYDVLSEETSSSLSPEEHYSGADRWRPLEVSLLHGSFEHLSGDIGQWDIITSIEVIEHLDPEPLALFGWTLLGELKPSICIVSTPNRDFNHLFNYMEHLENPSEIHPSDDQSKGFWKDGIPYRMRHHDHRFEWTRAEFQTWARSQGEINGYDVAFTGVGGFGNGMSFVDDHELKILEQAAIDCKPLIDTKVGASNIRTKALQGLVDSAFNRACAQSNIYKVFGDCSQIAVFVRKRPLGSRSPPKLDAQTLGPKIKVVCNHQYSHTDDPFPPALFDVVRALMQARLLNLMPQVMRECWDRQIRSAENRTMPLYDRVRSPTPTDTSENESILKGLNPEDIECVEVRLEGKVAWELSPSLQRLCRYDVEVFKKVLRKSYSEEPEKPSADKPCTTIYESPCANREKPPITVTLGNKQMHLTSAHPVTDHGVGGYYTTVHYFLGGPERLKCTETEIFPPPDDAPRTLTIGLRDTWSDQDLPMCVRFFAPDFEDEVEQASMSSGSASATYLRGDWLGNPEDEQKYDLLEWTINKEEDDVWSWNEGKEEEVPSLLS